MQFPFEPILFLSETVHRTTYGVSTEALLKMNWIATYLVQSHFRGQITVWDSHMALQKRYKFICLKYKMMDDPRRLWSCQDKLHSGSVITDQFAQMLLNHLCAV